MTLSQAQLEFLATASDLNQKYDVVRTATRGIPLCHSFWTQLEIENAKRVQEDWQVPLTMVPFYGDWHDLLCLNLPDGTIHMMDDGRRVIYIWPSPEDFLRCLAQTDTLSPNISGIIESESWLDL